MMAPSPMETLEAEHRVIQKVVAGMAVLADKLDGASIVDEERHPLRLFGSLLSEAY